jgi:hypothetical protein
VCSESAGPGAVGDSESNDQQSAMLENLQPTMHTKGCWGLIWYRGPVRVHFVGACFGGWRGAASAAEAARRGPHSAWKHGTSHGSHPAGVTRRPEETRVSDKGPVMGLIRQE